MKREHIEPLTQEGKTESKVNTVGKGSAYHHLYVILQEDGIPLEFRPSHLIENDEFLDVILANPLFKSVVDDVVIDFGEYMCFGSGMALYGTQPPISIKAYENKDAVQGYFDAYKAKEAKDLGWL